MLFAHRGYAVFFKSYFCSQDGIGSYIYIYIFFIYLNKIKKKHTSTANREKAEDTIRGEMTNSQVGAVETSSQTAVNEQCGRAARTSSADEQCENSKNNSCENSTPPDLGE